MRLNDGYVLPISYTFVYSGPLSSCSGSYGGCRGGGLITCSSWCNCSGSYGGCDDGGLVYCSSWCSCKASFKQTKHLLV